MTRIKLTGRGIALISITSLILLSFAVWGLFFNASAPSGVKAGDTVVVRVAAEQLSDMYAYQFDLLYDKAAFEYTGGLVSSISEINTIFAKEFDGRLRVGATKIGREGGFAGRQAATNAAAQPAMADNPTLRATTGRKRNARVAMVMDRAC